MRRIALVLTALTLGACLGCSAAKPGADAIYFGGPIITINDSLPSAEAVAITGGKIVAVGTRAEVEKLKGAKTQMIDLAGQTMIPGFVDAHGHFSQVGIQAIAANLLPPPDGPATSITQIQQIMRDYIANSPTVKEYGIALGFDYDDSQLAEHRHPNRHDLDAVSTELPILVMHQSGHLSVLNSKALELAGITAASVNPVGGTIYREAGTRTPSGLLDENAHITALLKLMPKFTPAQTMAMYEEAQTIFLGYGYTTAQDGRTDPANLAALPLAAKAGTLKLDVVAYPDLEMNEKNPVLSGPLMSRTYTDHFRIGGVKLGFDGSPQGKTAWFTTPYFKPPVGGKAGYKGFPIFPTDAEPTRLMTLAYRNHWQVMVHANGDAAIDQLIRVVKAAADSVPGTDRCTVLIHGQFVRADQIPELQALGIFPALFPMHTFYWGDWHRTSVVGPERAEFMSPTGAMLAAGIPFSIHHDAPVTFPNSMRVLDSAVNRTTRSGYVLGPEQRIEPIVALKAMTLWAAYQHFEEATKGSIEVGKHADLVILSDNPLTVERAKLVDLKVEQTIKDGVVVYRRSE